MADKKEHATNYAIQVIAGLTVAGVAALLAYLWARPAGRPAESNVAATGNAAAPVSARPAAPVTAPAPAPALPPAPLPPAPTNEEKARAILTGAWRLAWEDCRVARQIAVSERGVEIRVQGTLVPPVMPVDSANGNTVIVYYQGERAAFVVADDGMTFRDQAYERCQ